MASQFNPFPEQFAGQVLGLVQKQRQFDAELREMRSARASRNFLEKERVGLAEQAQTQKQGFQQAELELAKGQQQQQGQQQQFQQQLAGAKFERQLDLDAQKQQQRDQASIIKGISDFDSNGTGFIPEFARDVIGQLRAQGSGSSDPAKSFRVEEVFSESAGGSFVFRIGGTQKERKVAAELEKIQAETLKTQIEGVKFLRQADSAKALADQRRAKIFQMAGLLGDDSDSFKRLRQSTESFKALSEAFNDSTRTTRFELNSIESKRASQRTPEDNARVKELDNKLRDMQSQGPVRWSAEQFGADGDAFAEMLDVTHNANQMSAGGTNRKIKNGEALTQRFLGDVLTPAIDPGGLVREAVTSNAADVLLRMADSSTSDIQTHDVYRFLPQTFGVEKKGKDFRQLPTNVTVKRGGDASTFYVDTNRENGLVPLNQSAFNLIESNDFKRALGDRMTLSSRWRDIGWTPENSAARTQALGPLGAVPPVSAPDIETAPGPETREDTIERLQTTGDLLIKQINEAQTQGDAQTTEQLRSQLEDIIRQYQDAGGT